MNAHDCKRHNPWCYRCDLRKHETDIAEQETLRNCAELAERLRFKAEGNAGRTSGRARRRVVSTAAHDDATESIEWEAADMLDYLVDWIKQLKEDV